MKKSLLTRFVNSQDNLLGAIAVVFMQCVFLAALIYAMTEKQGGDSTTMTALMFTLLIPAFLSWLMFVGKAKPGFVTGLSAVAITIVAAIAGIGFLEIFKANVAYPHGPMAIGIAEFTKWALL